MHIDSKQFTVSAVATQAGPNILPGDFLAVQLNVGTLVGATIALEVTLDGTNFFPVALTPVAGGAAVTSIGAASGIWQTAGLYAIRSYRVNCSAITSGSGTVTVALGSEGR